MPTSIRMLIVAMIGVFALTAPSAAVAYDKDGKKDSKVDVQISERGFIVDHGKTALLKITYTCPEGAKAVLKVVLKQEKGKGNNNGRETVGSEYVKVSCTGYEKSIVVAIDAKYGVWKSGEAKAVAVLFVKKDGKLYKDFDSEKVWLSDKKSGHRHH